ncbi:MAG TPA: FAD-dependent oxidoreductase [Terricaulis sp.]|nr:FAD-dependent oxidoreductase [Terricaulis sp.]
MTKIYDAVVIGAGPAGLTTAIFAAERGASIALLEAAPQVGGAMLINRGQLSGAGSKFQEERGIKDTPKRHFDDAIRISRGTASREFLELAVELQGPFIDWLMDHGFEMAENMPRIIHGHEAYDEARTYWGREDGVSLVKVLRPMLEAHVAAGRIEVFTSTSAHTLLQDEKGAVNGVRTEDGRAYLGRAVVLASGGYAANPALFSRLHEGATLWSGSYKYSSGRGLEMGEAAGGEIILKETFLPNFGGFLDHTLEQPRYRAPGGLTPQDRPPWEIVVNREGERFYREDNESVDERTELLIEQTESLGFVIFDEAIRREAPSIFSYFPDKAERFFEPEGVIESAASLAALAEKCGINAKNLEATVAKYNEAVASGVDADFGRSHMPRQISQAPFYALPIVSYTVRGYAGLKVDLDFRVRAKDGQAVQGLYAVGEVLGSLLSGKGSVGGMSLTPALVFGRYLGERLPIG